LHVFQLWREVICYLYWRCSMLRMKFPAASFTGLPVLSESGFDLLNKLLAYDPEKVCYLCNDMSWWLYDTWIWIMQLNRYFVYSLAEDICWSCSATWLVSWRSTSPIWFQSNFFLVVALAVQTGTNARGGFMKIQEQCLCLTYTFHLSFHINAHTQWLDFIRPFLL
jgi:hypothetical protein